MRYIKLYLLIFTLFVVSCTSKKSDAKKVASLINKSIEKTHELKLDEAEKLYLRAQKIINKYEENDEAEAFFKYYVEFRKKKK